MGKGWGIPGLLAAMLLMGCDSVEVDPHVDPNAYHSEAMGIRFHRNDSHVIREITDADVASVSIVPGSGSAPWLMGGAALKSSSSTSSDAEDIDAFFTSIRFE